MRLQGLAKRAGRRSIWSTQTRYSTWPAHALVTASSRANYDMPRETGLIRQWLRRTWGAQAISL